MPDFLQIAADHKEWSERVFGTDVGPMGPLKHLFAEAEEAMENPDDAFEFADCMFLVMDAARRAGHDVEALLEAMEEKLDILQARHYDRVADGEPSFHRKD